MQGSTATRTRLAYHPAFTGPAMFQRAARSRWMSDDALTADTIRHMLAYIAEDTGSAPVQTAARQVRDCAATSSPTDLARATHQFMRSQARYVEDADLAAGLTNSPADAEVLIRPADLLSMADPQGDCDDFAMCTAAILSACQVPCSIKTAKCNPLDRGVWSHVYVVAHLPGGPMVLDTSHGPTPGWEVQPIFQARLWPVSMKLSNCKPGLGSSPDYYTQDALAAANYDAAAAASGGSTFDWGAIVGTTETAAAKILGARYGVAQMNPGQYIRNADGSILYQGTPGQTLNIPGLSGPTSSSTLLLLGVAAVVVVIAMTASKH